MSKFKVGDRVVYTGRHPIFEYSCHNGRTGKVRTVHSDGHCDVDWDDGERAPTGIFPENLDLVPEPAPAIDAHYTKYAIQPMEFSLANGLDAAQHTVIKYVVRYRDKGGVRDLRAAIRVLELMIEREGRTND